MPPQLCDISPSTMTTNLPNRFNLELAATATTATIMAPPEALPQRERFRINNVTQPFTVDHNEENNQNQPPPPPPQVLQQERITTSSFRHQQRRRRQQQYRQIDNNNRFAVLSDNNDDNDNDMVNDDNNDDTDDPPVSMNRNKKMKIKNKTSKKK